MQEIQQGVKSNEQVTAEDIKRIAEAVPMPAGTGHYQMKGDWDEGRQVYTVHEKENIITEYKTEGKGQPGTAQQMRKESYRMVTEKDGQIKRKAAEFDKKSGLWKDRNIFARVFSRFSEPPIVMGMMVKDASSDGKTLHVLEANRPVNDAITPVEVKTADDLKVELALKQGHAAETQRRADVINKKLQDKVDKANMEAIRKALTPKPPIAMPGGNI